jgi:hypothetical protein
MARFPLATDPVRTELARAGHGVSAVRTAVRADRSMTTAALPGSADWIRLARRTHMLSWFSLVWLTIEGTVAIAAGVMAGSIALVAPGLDSAIEGRGQRCDRLAVLGRPNVFRSGRAACAVSRRTTPNTFHGSPLSSSLQPARAGLLLLDRWDAKRERPGSEVPGLRADASSSVGRPAWGPARTPA